MIDLGIIQLPLEVINVIVIVTALLLAASYIGFDIIAAIGGIVAVVYGIRIMMYNFEVVITAYTLSKYDAGLMLMVGGFLIYRGTVSVFKSGDVNTWK